MKTILYLEGQEVITHIDYIKECFYTDFHEKFNHIVLDNLYIDSAKLMSIKYINPDYIHIRTTGLHVDKIEYLIDIFNILTYTPNAIIFYSEISAMALLGIARELKEKGTKFYYVHQGLEEISWI